MLSSNDLNWCFWLSLYYLNRYDRLRRSWLFKYSLFFIFICMFKSHWTSIYVQWCYRLLLLGLLLDRSYSERSHITLLIKMNCYPFLRVLECWLSCWRCNCGRLFFHNLSGRLDSWLLLLGLRHHLIQIRKFFLLCDNGLSFLTFENTQIKNFLHLNSFWYRLIQFNIIVLFLLPDTLWLLLSNLFFFLSNILIDGILFILLFYVDQITALFFILVFHLLCSLIYALFNWFIGILSLVSSKFYHN